MTEMRSMCFPRNVYSECFLSATVDCSWCLCDCLLASTVAMANPATPTVPEVRYEEMTGIQLAEEVASLTGRTVEEVRIRSAIFTGGIASDWRSA